MTDKDTNDDILEKSFVVRWRSGHKSSVMVYVPAAEDYPGSVGYWLYTDVAKWEVA